MSSLLTLRRRSVKLSDAIVFIFSLATDSPTFKDARKTEEGKEAVKLFKQLYKEVMAVESEGKDFNEEQS